MRRDSCNHPRRSALPCRREAGIALLTALLLMLAVLMTGIASTRGALQDARAAAHERDRVLALQMAHAGLVDAERDIDGGALPATGRAAAFANADPAAFASDCRGGTPYDGLCARHADQDSLVATLAEDEGPAVVYGRFTGQRMPDGAAGVPLAAPRYLIELMPPPGADRLFRVTARGLGSMAGTEAALQAYYLKPDGGGPGRRIGWRELGNWSAQIGASDD